MGHPDFSFVAGRRRRWRTKQVAEKLSERALEREKRRSGVKTPTHSLDLIGTDKSVPLLQNTPARVFPQPVKSCPCYKTPQREFFRNLWSRVLVIEPCGCLRDIPGLKIQTWGTHCLCVIKRRHAERTEAKTSRSTLPPVSTAPMVLPPSLSFSLSAAASEAAPAPSARLWVS